MSEMLPPIEPRTVRSVALARAGKLSLLGIGLIGAIFAIVVWGAQNANKPHEVRGEWAVFAMYIAHAGLVLWILFELFRAIANRPARRTPPLDWLWLFPTLVYLTPMFAVVASLLNFRFK
ncbi:MAG: hypothetical protein ACYTFV_15250 [Planctomycetota bacterium]|jgi:hypothetical protein